MYSVSRGAFWRTARGALNSGPNRLNVRWNSGLLPTHPCMHAAGPRDVTVRCLLIFAASDWSSASRERRGAMQVITGMYGMILVCMSRTSDLRWGGSIAKCVGSWFVADSSECKQIDA
jgi:hypothetical protein